MGLAMRGVLRLKDLGVDFSSDEFINSASRYLAITLSRRIDGEPQESVFLSTGMGV